MVLVAGGTGHQHLTRKQKPLRQDPGVGGSAWSDPRPLYEQPCKATLDSRHADLLQPKHRPAVTNPRISVRPRVANDTLTDPQPKAKQRRPPQTQGRAPRHAT